MGEKGGCFDLLSRNHVLYFDFAQHGAAQQPGGKGRKYQAPEHICPRPLHFSIPLHFVSLHSENAGEA